MKKKIVIYSAFVTPFRSGAESCVEEVSAKLKDQFDFTIVTARLRRSLPKQDVLNGVPVIRVGIGSRIDTWLYPFLAPFAAKKLKPDILHAVLESFAGAALILSRFIAPSPKRMLTCQSTNTTLLVEAMHHAAHQVTVISKVLIKRAQSFGKEAVLIPNGLNLKDIPERTKVSGRILFAGRLEPMKGIDTLIRSFALLQDPNATLHIVGEGSQRKNLEALVSELHMQFKITFLGFVPIPDVYEEFAAAEIFCGLSRSEALGNVFLEAQASGCAVIGTNVGGIPDIITDTVNGLLVEPDQPEEAAKALSSVLQNESLRAKLSAAGRENAAQYDWQTIADRYAAVYESL